MTTTPLYDRTWDSPTDCYGDVCESCEDAGYEECHCADDPDFEIPERFER